MYKHKEPGHVLSCKWGRGGEGGGRGEGERGKGEGGRGKGEKGGGGGCRRTGGSIAAVSGNRKWQHIYTSCSYTLFGTSH